MDCPNCKGKIILDRNSNTWQCNSCNFYKKFDMEKYLKFIEIQLKKLDNYNWNGIKQNDELDGKTNFIYNEYRYDDLLKQIDDLNEFEKQYAKNRWYNYHSAVTTEMIFSNSNLVIPNKNNTHKLIDFSINGINFDHKGTVYPKAFCKDIEYAKKNKAELIDWFYKNQSREGRCHYKNRLFVVFYKNDGEHWRAKSNIFLIKNEVEKYLRGFKEENLTKLKFNNEIICSDIIFVVI